MIAMLLPRLRPPVGILLLTACVACSGGKDRRAPPETAQPAPPVAVMAAEDRGKLDATAAPGSQADTSAFGHLEDGTAERAASKRGHDSAGEPAPGDQPGSGG